MKVHVVNFIKSLLVKDAFVPKLIKMCIKLLGIIITNKLLDVIQFFIAFDAGKHIKQMYTKGTVPFVYNAKNEGWSFGIVKT